MKDLLCTDGVAAVGSTADVSGAITSRVVLRVAIPFCFHYGRGREHAEVVRRREVEI